MFIVFAPQALTESSLLVVNQSGFNEVARRSVVLFPVSVCD